MDIVKILQIGFAGPAFLLALLSFKLLSKEHEKDNADPKNLDSITKFMYFALILGVLTFISPYFLNLIEEKPNPYMDAMVESTKNKTKLEPEFIAKQISILTKGHNERLISLYANRDKIEHSIRTNEKIDRKTYQESLRRIEGYIRDENREYNNDVRRLRYML